MRPQIESIEPEPGCSVRVLEIDQPEFDSIWHCHEECELTWIREGAGDRVIGDSLESFQGGDLVLLGSGLPHFWRTDSAWKKKSRATVIQFDHGLITNWQAGQNELLGVTRLLNLARRGIAFDLQPEEKRELGRLQGELRGSSDWTRLRGVLDALHLLGTAFQQGSGRTLSGPEPMSAGPADASGSPLQRVFAYIFDNGGTTATFEEAARRASMTPAAFSRFFRRMTGKTFTRYLHDIRLAAARRRLLENDGVGIAEIAFATGFGSLSTFNRLFLEKHGLSPRQWRAQAKTSTPAPPMASAI